MEVEEKLKEGRKVAIILSTTAQMLATGKGKVFCWSPKELL